MLRDTSPQDEEFDPYTKALADLVSRLGPYCSYCERYIATNLAVEHVQPKALYPALRGTWSNFLLGCVNCNSAKGAKDVKLKDVLVPDRDNTFAAYTYGEDGSIEVAESLTIAQQKKALATLSLVGLDRPAAHTVDANGLAVALDRVRQRQEAWVIAMQALENYDNNADNAAMLSVIEELARQKGFFSIWMTVFEERPTMRLRFVQAFRSTSNSGCFDADGKPRTPAPNHDALANGSKV